MGLECSLIIGCLHNVLAIAVVDRRVFLALQLDQAVFAVGQEAGGVVGALDAHHCTVVHL